MLYCFLFWDCVFLYFAFVAYDALEVEFLSFTSGDELPQFKQLNSLLQGFLNLDLEGMFRFEFYNYGYVYYLINLFITAPFNLAERYDLAIYAPRVLNGFFSVLNLWMVYKIANLYLPRQKSILLTLFPLLFAGFWSFGYAFKPDVFQAFFVLLSVYFLCLDSFGFGKRYYQSLLCLGLAIGVAKFQAIIFFPLFCLYGFCPFFQHPSLRSFISSSWRSLQIVAIGLSVWIVTNPYLLHPTGLRVWWNLFAFNMQSNASNHGSYIVLSLSEKIQTVLGGTFFNPLLLIIGSLALLFVFRRLSSLRVFVFVFLGFWISLLYLLLGVNKDWSIYYISTAYLGVLLLIPLCIAFPSRWVISLVCIIQCAGIFYYGSWKNFPKHKSDLSMIRNLDIELTQALKPIVHRYSNPQIYADYVNFSYRQLGLKYSNVHQIYEGLFPYRIDREAFKEHYPYKSPEKYFTQWQIIILDPKKIKESCLFASIDEKQKLSCKTAERLEDFGYQLESQSEHFLIFTLKDRG